MHGRSTACRRRARFSARRMAASAGSSVACRRVLAIATRSPVADYGFHERQEETMAGTSHVYAGIAGTVGMEHAGGLVGAFRQEIGDNKWQKLGGGLPEDAERHAITVPRGGPDTAFVGSTKGLDRSRNRSNRFEELT